jgi:hypothetical protein
LKIRQKSILSLFLNRISFKRSTNLFVGELLDILNDEDVFVNMDEDVRLFSHGQFLFKSKRAKLISSCQSLRDAYQFLGHYPLQERYEQTVSYLLREKEEFLAELSSLDHSSHLRKKKIHFP